MSVSKRMKEERMTYFKECCKEHGLRLTPQKLAIYEIVASTDEHPSAQEIYAEVLKKFSNLSFATVYDNLKKFKALKVLREVVCEGGCARFDANMDAHHHIINTKTGKIIDVELSDVESIPLPKELKGKKLKEIKISYYI